jgi:ATP-dependent RNA helicase RhlE
MGFIHDVKRIIATLPKERQTLFFSATMPNDVEKLANNILKEPVRIEVTPPATTVERIDQRVYFVDAGNKNALLADLLKDPAIERVLVFTRTKHGADRVMKHVERVGIDAQAIHGNKSQNARQRALNDFRDGKTRVLVATDIAARGIDVDGITHVINFEIPNVPETYVHRIGRTARAGRDGVALTFCDASEKSLLRDVERLTRKALTVVQDHSFHGPAARPAHAPSQPRGHERGHHAGKPNHQRSRQPSRDQRGRDEHGRDDTRRDDTRRDDTRRDDTRRDQAASQQRQQRQAPQQQQQRPPQQRSAPQERPAPQPRSTPQPHPAHKPGDRPMHRPGRAQPPAEGAAPQQQKRPHRHRRGRPQQAQA